jgi:hypothetical protein
VFAVRAFSFQLAVAPAVSKAFPGPWKALELI